MICLSVSDLKLATKLSGMSELEIIKVENDEIVSEIIYQLGIDTEFPWIYTANKHRNIRDQVLIGYRIAGEIRIDEEFRNSKLAGIQERLVISSYKDVSMMEEIAELAFKVRDFSEYLNDSDSLEFDEERALFGQDQLEPDWEQAEDHIRELNDILLAVRGSPYTSSGALKTMQDYKDELESREFYSEKYDC